MTRLQERSQALAERLGLRYEPVGVLWAPSKPEAALSFKRKGMGCMTPLIFLAAKGKTVAFDADSTGFPCSAFYLGYADRIFPGIENFLSDGPMPGRECERFVRTPEQAKRYLDTLKASVPSTGAVVFKPISRLTEEETPEVVLIFADADRLSALVYLAHFDDPTATDRVVTGFASACAACFTLPMREARAGRRRAIWGLHDIAIRHALPPEIMSFALPTPFYEELCDFAPVSFLETENWRKLRARTSPA